MDQEIRVKNRGDLGYAGGPVVEKSTCQCRRHRFDLWPWKVPHASGQLSSYGAQA